MGRLRRLSDAIHAVENEAKLSGKDILVDTRTSEVYFRTPRGGHRGRVGADVTLDNLWVCEPDDGPTIVAE